MPAHTLLPDDPRFVKSRTSAATETTYGRLEDGTLGWTSHGIDAHDMHAQTDKVSSGMQVHTHKLNSHRRLSVPDWVRDTKKLAEVYVCQLEKRAQMRSGYRSTTVIRGTIPERIAVAHDILERRRGVQLVRLIDNLCSQERELRQLPLRTAWQHKKMKNLQEAIRGADMELRCLKGDLILNIVDLYWRQGWNARQVAAHIGISHVHVRQTLCRLRRTAENLEHEQLSQTGNKPVVGNFVSQFTTS